MKVSIILFLAMTAVLCLEDNSTTATTLTKACPQNPFLPELKNNNVKLFEAPAQYQESRCGEEWKSFGLCCNETDLVEYVKQDQANITRAVEALVDTFVHVRSTFENIKRVVIKTSSSKKEKMNQQQELHQHRRSVGLCHDSRRRRRCALSGDG